MYKMQRKNVKQAYTAALYYTVLIQLVWFFGAVHKVCHAIFGQFLLPPPPVTLRHTSGTPRKYFTYLGTPDF